MRQQQRAPSCQLLLLLLLSPSLFLTTTLSWNRYQHCFSYSRSFVQQQQQKKLKRRNKYMMMMIFLVTTITIISIVMEYFISFVVVDVTLGDSFFERTQQTMIRTITPCTQLLVNRYSCSTIDHYFQNFLFVFPSVGASHSSSLVAKKGFIKRSCCTTLVATTATTLKTTVATKATTAPVNRINQCQSSSSLPYSSSSQYCQQQLHNYNQQLAFLNPSQGAQPVSKQTVKDRFIIPRNRCSSRSCSQKSISRRYLGNRGKSYNLPNKGWWIKQKSVTSIFSSRLNEALTEGVLQKKVGICFEDNGIRNTNSNTSTGGCYNNKYSGIVDSYQRERLQYMDENEFNNTIQILSKDPLIYTIPNFLSPTECNEYVTYATKMQEDYDNEDDEHIRLKNDKYYNSTSTTTTIMDPSVVNQLDTTSKTMNHRKMTKSNPPEVTIDLNKLWPLPILALLSGLPPFVRLLEEETTTTKDHFIGILDIIRVVGPNIMITLFSMYMITYYLVLPAIRIVSKESSRTSFALALNEKQDHEFIHPFVQRATNACTIPFYGWNQWEAPVITHYKVGDVFKRHNDASYQPEQDGWNELGGQRIVTCICYLNTVQNTLQIPPPPTLLLVPSPLGDTSTTTCCSGATYFDQQQIQVQPTIGTALFFFPANRTTSIVDDRTTHESLPILASSSSLNGMEGTDMNATTTMTTTTTTTQNTDGKWIVQLFGRVDRVPPPLGILDSFGL